MRQLHDVGRGKLAERGDRDPLDVAAEQHASSSRLDPDNHGAVVELPVVIRPVRVQPRPLTCSELTVLTGGNFHHRAVTLGEPAQQEHHRAIGITPGFPAQLRRHEYFADRECVGQLQRGGVVIEVRVADHQRVD